jgi:hypothetical protein
LSLFPSLSFSLFFDFYLFLSLSLSLFTGLITEDEVRPFLNSHFLSCRILSKIITTAAESNQHRAHYLVVALKRYEWLVKFAPKICKKRGLDVEEIFGEEWKICKEMVSLLPSKIDRMCYLGEKGLSL